MDPRRFDALTRALAERRPATSRRRLLTALPALAAAAVLPSVVRAFDAGEVQRPLAPGEIPCTSGADCPTGQVCINGVCGLLAGVGGRADAPGAAAPTAPPAAPAPAVVPTAAPAQTVVPTAAPAQTPTPVGPATTTDTPTTATEQLTPTPRAIEVPEGEDAPAAEATPVPAVGGGILADQPLPAGIYRGVCGALEEGPAFPLIDVGTEQAGEAPELPEGSPSIEGADFSSTLVSTTLDALLAEPYAVDVRLVADDPTTSIVCGNITAPDAEEEVSEIVIPLAEQNDSGASGVAWIQEEAGERSLAYVFVSRPDGAVEIAQPAGTPVAVEAFERGDTVVTLADVNLRAAPSTEAAIVEVLGTGVELEVTVDPRDGWVPVVEPATGVRGFVATDLVELAADA